MEILVTGASGFVGAALIPRLHARRPRRARVRAATPPRARRTSRSSQGDAVTGEGLDEALRRRARRVLPHPLDGDGRPRTAATSPSATAAPPTRFAAAARRAGVRRVVYLGGLVPAGRRPLAAPGQPAGGRADPARRRARARWRLRASIVIGARSRSFRFLVRLVERLPVLALPGLARAPHAADRRPRRDRVPRPRGDGARGGRPVARHRRARRAQLRRDDRADPRLDAGRPPGAAPRACAPRRSPAASPPRSPARTTR